MKAQKILKIIVMILFVILISIISFIGIFYNKNNIMTDRLPEYLLGSELAENRKITLKVKDDKKTENEKIEEKKTIEDLNGKSKRAGEIIKSRLKSLKVENYIVSVNDKNGDIEISLSETKNIDMVLSDITQKGKFTIVDSKTNEVLLTNSDIKKSYVKKLENYGIYRVDLFIEFNQKGKEKYKNITANYQKNEQADNIIQNQEKKNEVNKIEENKKEKKEDNSRKVNFKLDDSVLLSTDFDKIVDSGILSLTLGTTKDSGDAEDKYNAGANIASIIENKEIELDYEIYKNISVSSSMIKEKIQILIYAEIILALLISLVMIIKFRLKAVFTTILSIGFIAILLIVIRFTNVVLTIEGISGIFISYLINLIYNYTLLKVLNEKIKKEKERKELINQNFINYLKIMIPTFIVSVVFSLTTTNVKIYSLGMVMFWGLFISLIYNSILNIVYYNREN